MRCGRWAQWLRPGFPAGGLIRRHSPGNRRPPPKPNIEEEPTSVALLTAKEKFLGACLDAGAQHTVIGKPQAEAYMASIGQEADLETAKELRSYRLGGCSFDTLGAVSIRLPIAEDYFLPLFVKVIALNVPFLLGLDIMDRYRMYVNNVTNHLVCVNEGVAVPVVRKYGHIYLDWGSDILYTFSELQRIHKHFYHARPCQARASLRVYASVEGPGSDTRDAAAAGEDCGGL